MIYNVDLTGVRSPTKFHRRVREVLPVPDWYGDNLDALHDILTERKDWTVHFCNAKELREERPRYVASLERLCRECGGEITS